MTVSLEALRNRLQALPSGFEAIRKSVQQSIQIAPLDPEMAAARVRKVLELIIRDLFVRKLDEEPGTRPLENLIQRLVKDGHFPERLDAYAASIRKLGNAGAHVTRDPVTQDDVWLSLAQLVPILDWYVEGETPALPTSDTPSQQMRAACEGAASGPSGHAEPDNLLHAMWGCLDDDLQDALALAYTKKRRQGGNRISTKDFFQALVRLRDDSVRTLIDSLPADALPEPVAPEIAPDRALVMEESPLLSDCLTDSLQHFRELPTLPRKLSAADVFVDVARHGHGESVAQLRRHGVGEKEIVKRVRRLGIAVVERSTP
jgi:hypothetical protein